VQRPRDLSNACIANTALRPVLLADLETLLAHAARQIDPIRRRVLQGKMISPYRESFFSFSASYRMD
jgi:hypothetical protein